jgi:hypothetical protein
MRMIVGSIPLDYIGIRPPYLARYGGGRMPAFTEVSPRSLPPSAISWYSLVYLQYTTVLGSH